VIAQCSNYFMPAELRVSELAGAKLENLNFEEGIVRVTGKAIKRDSCRFGRKACEAISRYIENERSRLVPAPHRQRDFSFRTRGKLTTTRIWQIVKTCGRRSGLEVKFIHICFGTVSPRTCLETAPIYASSRRCSGMRIFRRHRFTHMSINSD